MCVRQLPVAGEITTQKDEGKSAQSSHRAGNTSYSHQTGKIHNFFLTLYFLFYFPSFHPHYYKVQNNIPTFILLSQVL